MPGDRSPTGPLVADLPENLTVKQFPGDPDGAVTRRCRQVGRESETRLNRRAALALS